MPTNHKQYVCSTCAYHFDQNDSFYEYKDPETGGLPILASVLCPKCWPEVKDIPWLPPGITKVKNRDPRADQSEAG